MTQYARTAILLHWAIAALLVFNYGLGERADDLDRGLAKFSAFQLHKSIGITILLLSLWRLWIRLRKPRPAPLGAPGMTQKLAELVHWGFYVIMIVVPISGWIIVSTSKTKLPTLLFGVIPWPNLPVSGRALHELAEDGHELLSKAMMVLILLHIVGAIRHQFLKNERLLERMIPVQKAGLGAMGLGIALLVASFTYGRAGPLPGMQSIAAAAPAAIVQPDVGAAVNAPIAASEEPANAMQPAIEDEKEAEKAAEEDAKADENKAETAATPSAQWAVTPGGRLGFGVTVNGEAVRGQFARWNGDIRFDPAKLEAANIQVSVDLATVSSGDGQRDSMLSGDDFFALAAHPRATFKADEVRSTGGNRYQARGTLSMKGMSRPMRLDFTLDIKGDTATARGTGQLDRSDFGVGTGQFEGNDTISKKVSIDFAFAAKRKG